MSDPNSRLPGAIDFAPRPIAMTVPAAPSEFTTLVAQPYIPSPATRLAGRAMTTAEIGELGKSQALAVAGIADKITHVARAGDIDEVGKALNGVLMVAKEYDPSVFKGGGLFGLFKKKAQEIKNHFAHVDSQVDQLVHEADSRIALFQGRVGDLEHLYEDNEARYHELAKVIVEVEARIEWMRANPPAVDVTDSFSAQHLADWNAVADYATKRCDDLRRAQMLAQQQGPQIRLMAQNSGALVMKFSEIKTTTIPVLKNAFALYILNIEQEKGAKFAASIDDLTNATLLANAKKLGQTTVAVQTSLARSTIDLSTLQQTQADLLKSLGDVQRIRSEMQTRLAAERPQLEQLSQQLAQRLSQQH